MIPGLQYRWTKGPVGLNMLCEADNLIAGKICTWLKMFHSIPTAFFRVPVADRGLITGKARLHAKLCKSADSAVTYVARNFLWGKELKQYARQMNGFQLGGPPW